MTVSEFRGPGLTDAQWERIKDLATSLDASQLLWVSGFLAGVEHAGSRLGMAAAAPAPAPDAPALPGITILYGSETGNSASLAAQLAERAAQAGLPAALHDMADYKVRQLKDVQCLLVVASTYGEGDPPQPATGFFEFIEGRKAPKLAGIPYAVLALGDSTYEHFCEAGKRLDRRLEELGAERLLARVDCDVDYEAPAQAWIGEAVAALAAMRPAQTAPAAATASSMARPATAPAFDKRRPFQAPVIERIALTGRGSTKQTWHVEVSLEGSGLAYEPGDALGFMPSNDPTRVDALLAALDLAPSTPVEIGGEPVALGEALRTRFDITALTPRFLEHWGRLADAEPLSRLALDGSAPERKAYGQAHHIIDVVRRFPISGLRAQTFVAGLRPLQPRLYSIASSLAAVPGEAHLTVATVRYALHGEPRTGIASGQLADRCDTDSRLPVYIQANPYFRLPDDDVPIVMIGAGTGVAPYRAFMQEREARGARGRSWLFFGERHFRTDFLYQTEWQALLKDGVLSRMDVAFSRDGQAADGARPYVQQRMREQARDLFAWLEEGAHLYVCGDANRLAPDVHQALADIVQAQGGFDADGAHDYLQRLQEARRYQRDVY